MPQRPKQKRETEMATDLISDAGGRVVGRTRLQKVAYLLEVAGLGDGFSFEYRHYGPYSEQLSLAARDADLLGLLDEEERVTGWGGRYSIFTVDRRSQLPPKSVRKILASEAAEADPIQLELAATAVFLAREGQADPWAETAKRKPEKAAEGRLEEAKQLYQRLRRFDTPSPLPDIG